MKEFIKKYITMLICIIFTVFMVCITTLPLNNWIGLIWGLGLVAYEILLTFEFKNHDETFDLAVSASELAKKVINKYNDAVESYENLMNNYNKLRKEYDKLKDSISNQEQHNE